MTGSQSRFYDEIAEYYDLIYADWEGSMIRHGSAISELLGDRRPGDTRILDVASGIGTQALPLAALGYDVVARDLSEGALRRLRREADARGLHLDIAHCDMAEVGGTVQGEFDAIIAMDNSIPHLLSDTDVVATLRGLRKLLAPGGVLLLSVRDYDHVDRAVRSSHPYGVREREGHRYRLGQEWEWYDASHYRTTLVVEAENRGRWREIVRTTTAYYALSIERVLEMMVEAGFTAERVVESNFFQPVLRGG